MRDWRKYWNEVEINPTHSSEEYLRQVGKTVTGRPVQLHQLDLIVDAIRAELELNCDDVVVDLGCGNGVVTQRVARKVGRIAGIDASTRLLSVAQTRHAQPNCSYHFGDLAKLGPLPVPGVTKAYSYEVLQHLTTAETRAMLQALIHQLGDRLKLFVGSIPERSKLTKFYNTPSRWARYERRKADGTEQIGHWWERDEVTALCDELGLICTPSDQTRALYTSHYRFDAKIVAR